MISIEIGLHFCCSGGSNFPLVDPGLVGYRLVTAQLHRFRVLVSDRIVPLQVPLANFKIKLLHPMSGRQKLGSPPRTQTQRSFSAYGHLQKNCSAA